MQHSRQNKDVIIQSYTILLSFMNSSYFSNSWLIVDYGGYRGMFDMPFVLHQISIIDSLVHDLELFEE